MKFDDTVNQLLIEAINSGVHLVNIDGELLYKSNLGVPAVYYKDPEARIPHRLNGPAYDDVITKVWYKDGRRHRINGPAVERVNGDDEWWIGGHWLTPEEVEEHKKKLALFKEIESHKNNRIDPGMLEDYL